MHHHDQLGRHPLLRTHTQMGLPHTDRQSFNARMHCNRSCQIPTSHSGTSPTFTLWVAKADLCKNQATCFPQQHFQAPHSQSHHPTTTNHGHPTVLCMGCQCYHVGFPCHTHSEEQTKRTENTTNSVVQLINYAATHPEAATTRDSSSDMILPVSAVTLLTYLRPRPEVLTTVIYMVSVPIQAIHPNLPPKTHHSMVQYRSSATKYAIS
jgi:hypothetical protein